MDKMAMQSRNFFQERHSENQRSYGLFSEARGKSKSNSKKLTSCVTPRRVRADGACLDNARACASSARDDEHVYESCPVQRDKGDRVGDVHRGCVHARDPRWGVRANEHAFRSNEATAREP